MLWQLSRALGGNSLSWAYVFEWPLFAAYAVYMWWRFVHEAAQDGSPADTAAADPGGAERGGPGRGAWAGDAPRRRRRTPSSRPTTTTWPSWPSGTRPPVADGTGGLQTCRAVLRGEGSNLQHPAPKADVLPIELPRTEAVAA